MLKKLLTVFMTMSFIFPIFSNICVLGETSSNGIIIEGIWKKSAPFILYSNGDLVVSGEYIVGRNVGVDVEVEKPEDTPAPKVIESWDGYEEYVKRIIIEEGVTGIGDMVFCDLPNVTELRLPDTLTSIGFCTFENNVSLTAVTIPKSVRRVGIYAFKGCALLSEVLILSKNIDFVLDPFNNCSDELTIRGYRNSSVQEYAEDNGLRFDAADADVPTASMPNCEFSEPFFLELHSDIENAAIYYTTDGSVPDHNSSIYTTPIYIDKTVSINAVAASDGYLDSVPASFVYLYVEPSVRVPTVVTNAAENITYNSALFSGKITDNGGGTAEKMHFVYWDKHNADVKYTVAAEDDFSARITNLAPDSEYYYYAAACNEYGTGAGEAVSFRTLTEKKPQSISVSPAQLELVTGGQYQLTVKLLPYDADNRNVIWSSSDTSVAQIDKSGKITAVGTGSAVITAVTEINRLKAYCAVTVSDEEKKTIMDFSEWNMATNTSSYAIDGWDIDRAISGGSYTVATAYLARWDGAVAEENDPYPAYDGNASAKYHEVDKDYIVNDVVWIQGRTAPDDNDRLKNAVIKYGALYVSYKNLSRCMDKSKTNYYYGYSLQGDSVGNHAVALVGWDDNYPASNFVDTPPGNGAFICKNSWGENYGENGYFYVSYYDMYFGYSVSAAFLASDNTDEYNKIYQYDPYGITHSLSYSNSSAVYGANIYPEKGSSLEHDETLKAVAFYTYYKTTNYEVYAVTDYKDESSLSNLGDVLASGCIDESGYHTVLLDKPVEVKKGTRFAVVIKLSSPDIRKQHMYFEAPNEDAFAPASANEDESYISASASSWLDMTEYYNNANLCIKAFTDTGSAAYSSVRYIGTETEPLPHEDLNYSAFAEENKNIDMSADGVAFENVEVGGDNTGIIAGTILPEKYDMREENLLTPVRDQGKWGTCWAHASYASLESSILKQTLQAQGALEPIAMDKDSIEMAKGTDTYLNVYNYQNSKIRWSSGDESVAVVDTNGHVTAVDNGETVIFAETSDGKHRIQCAVYVDSGEKVSSVELTESEVTKSVGDIFIIDYDVYPLNAYDKSVTWESSNPEVAAVNENGVITALLIGTAVITATSADGSRSDSAAVHVTGNMMCEITGVENNLEQKEGGIAGDVTVVINNKSDSELSPMVILALYNENGSMLGVRYLNADLSKSANSVVFGDIYAENVDIDKVILKVFVWDSLQYIQPIADSLCCR